MRHEHIEILHIGLSLSKTMHGCNTSGFMDTKHMLIGMLVVAQSYIKVWFVPFSHCRAQWINKARMIDRQTR